MNLSKTLNLISYLKWFFLIWMIILLIQIFSNISDLNIAQIGTVIFLCGIFMGFESLGDSGDSGDLSKKDKKFYSNKKLVKIQSTVLISTIVIILVISLFFLSLQYVFPTMNAQLLSNFSDLALDCLALLLGLLCMLKQFRDKKNAYLNS